VRILVEAAGAGVRLVHIMPDGLEARHRVRCRSGRGASVAAWTGAPTRRTAARAPPDRAC